MDMGSDTRNQRQNMTAIQSQFNYGLPIYSFSTYSDDIKTQIKCLKSSLKVVSSSKNKYKSVKFSNNLELVRLFNYMGSPRCVSLSNSLSSSPLDSINNSPILKPISYLNFNYNFNFNNNYTLHSNYSQTQYKLTKSNFAHLRTTPEIIASQGIKLTALTILNDTLIGTVQCLNINFTKKFEIKLTNNNWKTSIVFTKAAFTKSINDKIDEFTFKIPLYKLLVADSIDISVEMCIGYFVDGASVWDNHLGANYKFMLSYDYGYCHDYDSDYKYL